MIGAGAMIRCLSAAIFVGSFMFSCVDAMAEDTVPPSAPAVTSKKEPRKSSSNLEARHKDCLAFIQRHGLSCDPWEVPTCGHDIGYVRPLSCVAP